MQYIASCGEELRRENFFYSSLFIKEVKSQWQWGVRLFQDAGAAVCVPVSVPSVRRLLDSSEEVLLRNCLLRSPEPGRTITNKRLQPSGEAAVPWTIHRPLRTLRHISPNRKKMLSLPVPSLGLRVLWDPLRARERPLNQCRGEWWAEHTVETLLKCEQQEHLLQPDSLVWPTSRQLTGR